MSLLKKAVVTFSALALAGPIVANGAAGVVSAAATSANVKTENVTQSNAKIKTPLRNADSIFNLGLEKQKNGYVFVANIVASGNNVIQKGDQLVVNFNKENVDLDNSSIVNADGALPYTVKKNPDKGTVTFTFNKDVDSGNYQTAVGLATKNVYTTTSVKANFQGSPVTVNNNQITSKWQSQQSLASSNGTTTTTSQQTTNGNTYGNTYGNSYDDSYGNSYGNTYGNAYDNQGTSSYGQNAMTQSAATSSATTTSSASTSYNTTSYTTYQQATNSYTTQNGSTAQAGENNTYQPTYKEAEKAIMGRTTISVTGEISNNTETAANQTDTGNDSSTATSNKATTNNNSSSGTVNSALPDESTTGASTSNSANTANTENSANTANTANTENSANNSATTDEDNEATQADTTGNNATQTATTDDSQQTTATEQPVKSTNSGNDTGVQTQAGTNASNVIQTPDGKASDPAATLNEVLKNNDTDPNNADNTGDTTSYQKNSTFEMVRKDIDNKAPTATAEEQAEIVKVMPWIWSNAANAASQDQVFNYATRLSTGRTAYTTINGVADANSTDVLQQQMPGLLKAFGENIADDAFDKAMDIDTLLDSQLYQDYLAGKYTTTDNKLDASDAWSAMKDHITITKVDSNTDTTGAQKIDKRYYNAKTTLDNLASEALAKKNAEEADSLVINKDESANKADDSATTETEDTTNATGSKLFSQIQSDINNKMGDASTDEKAEILGSMPGILHDISKKTSSSDKTGMIAKYLQDTTDGNSYLITLDTNPITGSSDKYLANLPQVFRAFGDSLKNGDFDKAISTEIMQGSQIYQDYKDGKYVPDALVTKKTVDNKDDLFGAIILAMIACPVLLLAMPVVTILTSPIWVPLAIATWGIVFAITALPIGFIYTVLGALILPSLVVFPIMLVVSLVTAPILLIANLIPIINLITIPLTIINLALTFIPGFIVLSFIPMLLLAAGIVLAGIAIPIVMTIGLVVAQVIAGIISIITGGLIAMLVPITALLGLVIAAFAVLTVVAGGFAGVIGLGLIAGLAVVLLGYLAFNFAGILAGLATFLILLVLIPQFLVLNFLKWFIGFGFMALIFTDLAIPSLELAVAIGGLMMLFFVPGLLIALSWPFWMGLVLQISIPIVEIAALIALPFSFIPLFGWIADAIVGVIILIQAIALDIAITAPIVIGVLMMTVGIIGFDIAAAAAAVLELIKKKKVAERIHVNIDPSWRLKIRQVGFWTKSDPLATALA